MKLPNILKKISKRLLKSSAKAVVVGGSVRDHFLNLPIKDYDIEIYGLNTIEELESILKEYGDVNLVGKSFGILKFTYQNEEYDFSFPRVEKKISKGHRGFSVTCSGDMSFKEASLRRDFTINAMGYDIEEERFLDPYGGLDDIKKGLLRVVNSSTFREDPLRVYRAIQFCARFEYRLSKETKTLCKEMVDSNLLDELPKERIYMEFKKLLLKSSKPSIGFKLIRELEVIKYYPELKAIIDIPQSTKYHPEGDVWTHTLLALDEMAELREGEDKKDLKLMFAILCHDFGKATHTQIGEDRISAIGHEIAGVKPTISFLKRLTNEQKFIDSISMLVKYHLAPTQYYIGGAKDKTIRKLSTKVNIEELVKVARADFLGRTTKESLSGVYKAGDWLLEKSKELEVLKEPPKPLLRGKDLISLGLKPSKEFKIILSRVYKAQISGEVRSYNEAILFVILMELNSLADSKYREFNKKIVQTKQEILGVKVPLLRKIAKRLSKENPIEFIKLDKPKIYELILLEGLILSYIKGSFLDKLILFEDYLKKVDSWAQVDSVISSFKTIKKEKTEVLEVVKKWLKSDKEFMVRTGLVILLTYYIEKDKLDTIFKLSETVKHQGYYVKMANAWLISVCMVKFPNETLIFLKDNRLDKTTHNKAIQKSRESFRLLPKYREILVKLKKS